MNDSLSYIHRIVPVVRCYDWGMPGESSLVYRLYTHGQCNKPSAAGDELSKPYAELWIGDHASAPCAVLPIRRKLSNNCSSNGGYPADQDETCHEQESPNGHIENPEMIRLSDIYSLMGRTMYNTELKGPSILFKVLSIAKPLSLQIHPDQASAARMYQQKYKSIVDSQSKPEMCVALSPFRLMCGLRPVAEILHYANRYVSFAKLIGKDLLEKEYKSDLMAENAAYLSLCRRLLSQQEELGLLDELVEAVEKRDSPDLSEQVLLILRKIHGRDICVAFAFILNCIQLREGDSCFIPHNTLHSYISGKCVELMNNSDNVIRCGLTTKETDVDAVLELLEAESRTGSSLCQRPHAVEPQSVSPHVKMYHPVHPAGTFSIWSFIVPAKTSASHCFNQHKRPFLGILLETNDNVNVALSFSRNQEHRDTDPVDLKLGDAFVMYPDTTLDVKNDGDTNVIFYFGTEMNTS